MVGPPKQATVEPGQSLRGDYVRRLKSGGPGDLTDTERDDARQVIALSSFEFVSLRRSVS